MQDAGRPVENDDAFAGLMRVLREPSFAYTAREALRDYVSWSELSARELPPGLSAEQVWQLLTAIRRIGATNFPIPVATGDEFWYTITVEGRRLLRTIERHCRSDSRLHQMVQHRTGQRFLVDSHVQEAIATCRTDGVEIDEAESARMLHEGRAPRTPAGRLVRNTFEMLAEAETLLNEDFTPELARHLYARVVHGVDVKALPRSSTWVHGVPSVFQEFARVYALPRVPGAAAGTQGSSPEALWEICDYVNGLSGDPRESVAAKGYLLLAAMGYWHPLPDFNATVARQMLRIFSARQDFPVLGYLPINAMTRRWALGGPGAEEIRYSRIEPSMRTEDGIDGTAEILVHLQLTVAAINDLRSRIDAAKSEDEELARTLRDVGRFNYRQRELLARALRAPEAEFTFREHRLSYRTVYSTARADLLELVELGYLLKEMRGPAFVFTPVPDLRERLSAEG